MRYTDIWIVESLIEAKNNAKSIEDNLDDISTIVHNNPEIENDILVSMKELLLQQQETLEQLEAKIKEIFEPKIGHEPTDESITEVSQEDVEYEFDHLAGATIDWPAWCYHHSSFYLHCRFLDALSGRFHGD